MQQSNSERNSQLIAAGALLPLGTSLAADCPVDTVSARSYRHRALGERVVVRLTPDVLAAGEDITFATLGFEAPNIAPSVAQQAQRGLGFPGWALVNDPKNARYALDVMKDFRREAKRAASKPGHAKEGFDALAGKLARSAPHFLPSFYEEAGRAFITQGNSNYASQCFSKAREAERTQGLEVDEALRMEAFAEFALAGAVSIKALSTYAKDLRESLDAVQAYSHFRRLTVRRTLGGLPPWKGMAKELRKLADEAKLERAQEDQSLLEELLESSAIAKAPKTFWKDYEAALKALVDRSGRALERVLSVIPAPPGDDDESFIGEWIALLDRLGVIAAYEAPIAVEQKLPAATHWFEKLLRQALDGWGNDGAPDALFALLRRLAPRLKEEGLPLKLEDEYDQLELDLCDLALELGLAVRDPSKETDISLHSWSRAADQDDGEEHPRDPVHVAADPRFAALLDKAVASEAGDERFERHAAGKSAMLEARRRWLTALLDSAPETLPELQGRIERVTEQTTVKTFVEFPEALPKLQGWMVAPSLTRTLRGGIFGELWWKDFEAACLELGDGKTSPFLSGPFPHLVVSNGRRAIVLGAQGRVLEHDLQVPQNAKLRHLLYLDGQLLVAYRDRNWVDKGYWSANPRKKLDLSLSHWGEGDLSGVLLPLPAGGAHTGKALLRAGDSQIPDTTETLFSDGQSFWQLHYSEKSERHHLRELDPETGALGRTSLPRFFEEFATGDTELALGRSMLRPAPTGLMESPLGYAEGMLGWRFRVKRSDEGELFDVMERIDGVRWQSALEDGRIVDTVLSLPGAILGVDDSGYGSEVDCSLWEPSGTLVVSKLKQDSDDALSVPLLPPHYWHYFRPRDEAGSLALRTIEEGTVGALLASCSAELKAAQEGGNVRVEAFIGGHVDGDTAIFSETLKLMEQLLPAISDRGLRREVLREVAQAALAGQELAALCRGRDPENRELESEQGERDERGELIHNALRPLLDDVSDMSEFFPALRTLDAFFAEGKASAAPECEASWYDLLGDGIVAAAFLAPSQALDEKERPVWLDLLRLWADSVFCREPESFRVGQMELRRKALPFPLKGDWSLRALGEFEGDRFFLPNIDSDDDEQTIDVVQYSPSGNFVVLPGAKVKGERRFRSDWATPERLRAVVAMVEERGVRPFERAHAEALAEQAGASYGEAALLLAGLPNLRSYDRNFLAKEVREQLGLKVNEADMARQPFKALSDERRRKLFEQAMPDDPAALYALEGQLPGFLPRLAAGCRKALGKRVQIEPEIALLLDKRLARIESLQSMLPALTAPKKDKRLTVDGRYVLDAYGDVEEVSSAKTTFDGDIMAAVSAYVATIHYELPVGHALGAQLVELVQLAQERTRSEHFLLDGPFFHAGNLKKNQAFVDALGGEPYRPKDLDAKAQAGRDTGELIAFADPDGDRVCIAFRPGKVRNWVELCKLGEPESWGGYSGYHRARAAEVLLSERILQIAERTAASPLEAGSYEANPKNSAPKLVASVAEAREFSPEAACLYLQLLALPAPTDSWVRRLNGWSPKVLRKAGEELLAAKLVIKAKRAGAGRELFLPGAWEPLKAPNSALESWKLPLYGVRRTAEGKLDIPLGPIVPVRPLHVLFEQVWQRIESGDIPCYEQATARRRR